MAIVKADGYGHGAVAMARLLEEMGVEYLGVSNINEAMQLRHAGLRLPVLILGYTPPPCAGILVENNLTQTIYSYQYACALSQACAGGNRLAVHIKTDTGMSRLGFNAETGLDGIMKTASLPGLELEGLFTHFAQAGDAEFTLLQLARFNATRKALSDNGIWARLCHCANSMAAVSFPCTHLDMIRPGLLLYGHSPAGDKDSPWGLRPAMSLHTVVSQIKDIARGDGVSYERSYIAGDRRRVAVIPVGYADGYPRLLSNKAGVLVNGKEAPVLGNICMDMTMIDVTGIDGVEEGSPVVLFGNQGKAEKPVEELAHAIGTVAYEIICNVGKRVPRVYKRNGSEIGYQDLIAGNSEMYDF